ncbi:MAG: pyrroline-5-carboxylate reductase family protein [Nitrososphaeria archaeon]
MFKNASSWLSDNRMNIGIIGIGNMGHAFSVALSRGGQDRIIIYDRGSELRRVWKKNVVRASSVEDLAKSSEIIFIAVRPADVDDLLERLKNHVAGKTIVSVVALYPFEKLRQSLQGARICKIMTSVASETGKAPVLAYCEKDNFQSLKDLLSRFGEPFLVDEKTLDMLVPIVGSGPALLAYFLDSLSEYMVLAGVERDLADKIANLTAYSTSYYLLKRNITYYDLSKKVTTPSGITIKILHEFNKRTIKGNIVDAIHTRISEAIKK